MSNTIEALVNASYFADFASTIYSTMVTNTSSKWIIDSGASCHVCYSLSLQVCSIHGFCHSKSSFHYSKCSICSSV